MYLDDAEERVGERAGEGRSNAGVWMSEQFQEAGRFKHWVHRVWHTSFLCVAGEEVENEESRDGGFSVESIWGGIGTGGYQLFGGF